MGLLNKLSQVNEAVDTITKIGNDFQRVCSSSEYMKEELRSYNNGTRMEYLEQVKKIRSKETRLLRLTVLLWGIMVVTAVILCILRNDSILQLFGL